MTKKEFKKKCKAEKTKSYQYTLAGGTLVMAGFIVAMVVMLLDQHMHLIQFPVQIIFYVMSGTTAIVGMVYDILGEITFNKEYKEYLNSNSKQSNIYCKNTGT